jgi:hypothetical protein
MHAHSSSKNDIFHLTVHRKKTLANEARRVRGLFPSLGLLVTPISGLEYWKDEVMIG